MSDVRGSLANQNKIIILSTFSNNCRQLIIIGLPAQLLENVGQLFFYAFPHGTPVHHYHRWINLQPLSVLTVHVQQKFNSNANTYFCRFSICCVRIMFKFGEPFMLHGDNFSHRWQLIWSTNVMKWEWCIATRPNGTVLLNPSVLHSPGYDIAREFWSYLSQNYMLTQM